MVKTGTKTWSVVQANSSPLAARTMAELQRLVDERYLPALPPYEPTLSHNQPVDYRVRRRGRHFYIMTIYETPERDGAREQFDSPVVRLENRVGQTFSLGWLRHTGKWHTLAVGLSLDECLEWIRDHPLFEPR